MEPIVIHQVIGSPWSDFWTDTDAAPPVILMNPKHPVPTPKDLPPGLILFATSGSSGPPKWICHTRETLLASARAVNERFQISTGQHWLRTLPLFHVGGFSIHARAYLSQSQVIERVGDWNASACHDVLQRGKVAFVSLVPTQLHDLVQARLEAPASLRAAIIGGGAMNPALRASALALGWPIVTTYGMTEAASQIAVEDETGQLKILDHWEARTNADDCLEIRGPALAVGTVEADQFMPWKQGDWFTTADRVVLEGRYLQWLGRKDQVIKILGELVNLTEIERQLSELASGEVIVLALPDARKQHRLVASANAAPFLAAYHQTAPPFARIESTFPIEKIQRSPLGKVMRAKTLEAIFRA
jgi:o-succinylbenzoate---CoA ligase